MADLCFENVKQCMSNARSLNSSHNEKHKSDVLKAAAQNTMRCREGGLEEDGRERERESR